MISFCTRVDFISNGWSNMQWRFNDTAAPYSITLRCNRAPEWSPVIMTAEAFDAAGNSSMAPYVRRVTIQ